MAVKRIFVNPGDLIQVHVIDDPELPKNSREWECSKPNPFRFLITANKRSVGIHDYGLDIRYYSVGDTGIGVRMSIPRSDDR